MTNPAERHQIVQRVRPARTLVLDMVRVQPHRIVTKAAAVIVPFVYFLPHRDG